MNDAKKRTIIFYRDYFSNFYLKQRQKVKDKILWTFRIIETQEKIPNEYFKFIENSEGLFEIRVSQGNDIFRIFCFFDKGNLIVLANGFQKKSQKTPRTEIEKAIAIKKNMKTKTNKKTLDQFVEEQYGKRGTAKREKFEKGYENFKIGVLIQQARLEKGLTQDQLAMRCGTNKGYISKIENDIKEVRLSTLQRIVEIGLGGHLDLSIRF